MDNIGRYSVIAELGRGGMATVYKAHDPQFGREVAIKVLPPQFLHDPAFAKRFYDEARTIARLENRCILPVYDFGEAEGVPYIVMRLMAHGSLSDEIRKVGPMPLPRVARIISQVAEALDYAHSRNIVHRDLKPANLLLDEAGNVYLSDFGLAKLIGESQQASRMVAGTPAYMAPEQSLGQMPTPRTDVYALGALAFELLAGRPPFQASDFLALMYLHAHEPVPQIRALRPEVPAGVQPVLEKAMAKEASSRYASAGELAGALLSLLGQAEQPNPARPEKPPRSTPKPTRPPKTIITPIRPGAPQGPWPDNTASLWARAWRQRGLVGLGLAGVAFVVVVGAFAILGLSRLTTGGAPPSTSTAVTAGGKVATPPLTTEAAVIPTAMPASATKMPAIPTTPPAIPAATPALALSAITTQVSTNDGMVQVFVPAGNFLMGSSDRDSSAQPNEKPQHTVYLDAFLIDRTDVTTAMYARCVAAGACQAPTNKTSDTRSTYYGDPTYADFPVINVSWDEANTYCRWAGRRLPTEAEWEKAARGTDGRLYPWGNDAPNNTLLDYQHNVNDTTLASSYPRGASPYGALNMAGNVLQWVADWYGDSYYAQSPASNPTGPTGGQGHVLRGGSWNYEAQYARAAYRFGTDPSLQVDYIGFRCAHGAS